MEHTENQGNYLQSGQQWICPDCESVNTADSCVVCGCSRPQRKTVDDDGQGSYPDAVLEWVCPDCETVNTGASCIICGCSRPQEKPSEEQITGGQGSYAEAVSEWVCPDCETCNTGSSCTVCGHPRPELGVKGHISKKAVIAVVVAAVIVISVFAGIAVWLPYHRYQSACSLLESGQYEQAYQVFSKMENYRDSASKSEQALCGWAENLAKTGEYELALEKLSLLPQNDHSNSIKIQMCTQWAKELNELGNHAMALNVLESLPDDESVISVRRDIQFNYALFLLNHEHNYKEAYMQFTELGDYVSAEKYKNQTVTEWYKSILEKSNVLQAIQFKNTVTLTAGQTEAIYRLLCNMDIFDYSGEDGASWSYNGNDFRVRGILLDMLTPETYVHMEELRILFSEFNANQPAAFVREHRDILENLWYMPVVQNIVVNDFCIDEWLLGTWRTENGSYYIKFTKSDSGGYDSSHNVPWVAKPTGTKYYYINNMTYSWTDQDSNVLAEVYRFKLLEPDKIEVYAFKNQQTYTMVRK